MATVFVLTFTDDIDSFGTVVAGAGWTPEDAQDGAQLFAETNLNPDGVDLGPWSEEENDWGCVSTARGVDPNGRCSGVFEVFEVTVVGKPREG